MGLMLLLDRITDSGIRGSLVLWLLLAAALAARAVYYGYRSCSEGDAGRTWFRVLSVAACRLAGMTPLPKRCRIAGPRRQDGSRPARHNCRVIRGCTS